VLTSPIVPAVAARPCSPAVGCWHRRGCVLLRCACIAAGVQSSCVARASDNVTICPASFPNPVNFGMTFNKSLFHDLGAVIGIESRALWLAGCDAPPLSTHPRPHPPKHPRPHPPTHPPPPPTRSPPPPPTHSPPPPPTHSPTPTHTRPAPPKPTPTHVHPTHPHTHPHTPTPARAPTHTATYTRAHPRTPTHTHTRPGRHAGCRRERVL
jgi:hypothetical protein